MCLYHVLAPGPCVMGLCWVWSWHGPPSCGQAQSCSPFIILTSRRDPINHSTSFANVTSLNRTLPGREPQQSCGGWVEVEDSRLHPTDPQQGFQAPRTGTGTGRLLSVVGSLRLNCQVSFRKLSGARGHANSTEKAAKSQRHGLQ